MTWQDSRRVKLVASVVFTHITSNATVPMQSRKGTNILRSINKQICLNYDNSTIGKG